MRDENNTFMIVPFENGLFYVATEKTDLVEYNEDTKQLQFTPKDIMQEIEEEHKPFIDELIDLYR